MSNPTTLEPRQERSRATVERLLNATIGILNQAGLEGALIPRIAKDAGMAPANVYRRFVDKEALIRAAFLHALSRSNQNNEALLAQHILGDHLADSVAKVIALMFQQYRSHPLFMRSLSRFIETDSDQEFVSKARAILGQNLDCLIRILLAHREEIRHAQPETALRFAVLQAACAVEVYALDDRSIWHLAPAFSEEELARSLTDSFVLYLTRH
ncbi:TetR/AcrR family transcriptional regulator [Pseudoduganella sp. GCM10020061]|uniref:TetR/AcrR family transcriptional regulator n=1 Tax=Pseudoduganella sp. GCM10020061 TaxID=3317345 RepID=UPI00362A3729